MGMTWSEYKAYREKKKKEEEQTKKQQKTSSNKAEKTITNNENNQEKNNNLINTISQNNRLPLNNENANKIASNTPSLQDIVSKNNSSKIVQTNNNPLAKKIEEQNANKPLQKAIEEQKKKPKTTQKEPSTWERIMDNFRIGGYGGITGVAQTGYRDIRDIDNMYTDASSLMRHQVLSTFFGEHGENFARAVDDKLYKWNNDRNQIYNYALDVLNKEQQTNKQNIQQNIEAVKQSGDKVGTKFAELAPSVGNNAMGLLAGTVNPALAFTYYKGSSEASYYDDALQRGMTEDQAKVYSKLMSYVEAGTETISAGNILKGGKAIKAVASGAKNIGLKEGLKAGFNVFKESAKEETANALKQGLKSYGIGIAEEFFQEAITEPIQEFTAMKVAGEDKADWNNMWQRMLQSGVDGALSSAILAGANMGISSCQGIVTKVQNGQEFTTEEYNTAIKDASEKVDVGKMTTDGIKNQVEKLKTEMQQSQNEANKDINQEIKTAQNPISQEQNVANNQNVLYNNSNESESDINERNIEGHTIERGNGIYEKSESQQVKNREYNWDEYNKWEQSIKPVTESNLTSEEKQSINQAKQEHNKDVVLYDENDNDNTYSGGASRDTKNKITISRQQAETFGLDKMIYHENVESDIIHNDTARDILSPIVELIKEDENFNNQKENFWKEQKDNIPSDDLIAKDILCDRFSEMKSGEKVDYDNVLSNATNSSIDMALTNYYKQVYGKELDNSSSIILPLKQKQEVKLPLKETNNTVTKGETINWLEIEKPEDNKKIRKHYRSIIESSNTTAEAKSIAKELMGTDTYVPETNKGQLMQADARITNSTPDVELQSLLSKAMNGEKISPVDIAIGERLIQYYSKTGSKQQLQDAIQATALAGTSAGQTVQALSMLNHQTPQGQATWIQRSVDKMNKELAKRKGGTITTDADGNQVIHNKQGKDITGQVNLFDLTPEMLDKIVNSENQEQMYKNIDEVYEELGQQVPKSIIEKLDSWRYFSMLANVRTHARNIIGNLAMGKAQRVKDKIAGGIEDVVSKFNPEMERTKTLRLADDKTIDFAKNDFKNADVQSRLELNENKYNPQSRLQNARRTFKHDTLENTLGGLFNINDKSLSTEDGWGLKGMYWKALSDYITANKIDVDNITDAQLNKARNYAVKQAKEATFHQANKLATLVNQLEKNKVGKFAKDALMPFVKTPLNVAKAGMEYNPAGLIKTIVYDSVQLNKGNISVNDYIDNLSKGLTGTGISLLGYVLADLGILKASGDDDKDKENFEEEQGKQRYSMTIAGKTVSLDWVAPVGIPLFVGAEIHNLFKQSKNEKNTEKSTEEDNLLNQSVKSGANLLNAMATSMNPMTEMSMISSLTNALSSYNKETAFGELGINMGKSYINQYVPTLLGQTAKTGDEYERSTKSTKTGIVEKNVDQLWNQIKSKVPGLRQTLPIKTNIWGDNVKQEVNLPLRAFNNFINPATVKGVSTDQVDKELNKLYDVNNNSSVLPEILQKTLSIDNQKYRLTNKEYADYTKKYGETSYKLINDLIKSKDYKTMSQEQKEEAISNIYSYAKEANKIDYANKVNAKVKESTLYTTMNDIKKNNGNESEYLSYLSKTKGLEKESQKNKVLANMNCSDKTKKIIYTNGTGKDDKLYNNLLSKSNIDMTEYLDYKDKVSSKAFKADKNKKGKIITGSGKNKLVKYANENITGVGNRLMLVGSKYALKSNEKQALINYVNKISQTKEEKIKIYKQLDKNFVVKNGKVYMKVSKK